MTPSDEDLLRSAKREQHMRERVYPRLVQQRKLTSQQAQHELDCQRAIVKLLQAKVDAKSPGLPL